MVQDFINFIDKEGLFTSKDKVLLAVSGGKDSTLLAYLFHESNFEFGIAHCNFKLRGLEADKDQAFVKHLALKFKVPFYHINFDTKKISQERQISIQMAARDLRYEWLNRIRQENNYQYIATAHHLNDSIETVLYNLTKGCGIRGLQGIPVRNKTVIRPLLFASGKEILQAISSKKIQYREDLSNQETKYVRNKIRHLILPQLQQLNPAITKTFLENIERFKDTFTLFEQAVDDFKNKHVQEVAGFTYINKVALDEADAKHTLLYEITKDMGFSATQIKNALEASTQVGAIFNSKNHRLLVDRSQYIIAPQKKSQEEISIPANLLPSIISLSGYALKIKKTTTLPPAFPSENNMAYIDAAKLIFPLTIRTWKTGDHFQPLGMKGKTKKVQDFFSDQKLSIFDKESQLLLVNKNGEIIWIMGMRLDERYKMRKDTREVVVFTIEHRPSLHT